MKQISVSDCDKKKKRDNDHTSCMIRVFKVWLTNGVQRYCGAMLHISQALC